MFTYTSQFRVSVSTTLIHSYYVKIQNKIFHVDLLLLWVKDLEVDTVATKMNVFLYTQHNTTHLNTTTFYVLIVDVATSHRFTSQQNTTNTHRISSNRIIVKLTASAKAITRINTSHKINKTLQNSWVWRK